MTKKEKKKRETFDVHEEKPLQHGLFVVFDVFVVDRAPGRIVFDRLDESVVSPLSFIESIRAAQCR